MVGSPFRPNFISSNEKRAFYNFLRALDVFKGKVITEGELILMTVLTSTGQIVFNVTQGAGTLIAGEQRLQTSDAFWAMEHRFSIAKVLSGETTYSIQEELFPNEYVFTDPGENLALRALYFNGKINLNIDNTIYLDTFRTRNFENANMVAKDLAISANGTDNLVPRSYTDKDYGYVQMTPNVLLNGDFSNSLAINMDASQNMASAAPVGATNYAIYRFRGFIIQGGAAKSPQIKAALQAYNEKFNK